jgi:outer membrane lipoprotein SlyB
MNTQAFRTHPIIVIAGIAVTIFALIGSAAIMGWLPKAHTEESDAAQAKLAAKPAAETVTHTREVHEARETHEKPHHVKIASSESTHAESTHNAANTSHTSSASCFNCGVVQSVNVVEVEGKGSGIGVVTGGVLGGLLGNQVGQGNGKTVATVVGAAGGAYAGNKVEKNINKVKAYDIVVRMHDGGTRTFHQNTDPGLASGDKVKIENEVVIRQ